MNISLFVKDLEKRLTGTVGEGAYKYMTDNNLHEVYVDGRSEGIRDTLYRIKEFIKYE